MPVIPDNKGQDEKRIIGKRVAAEEEERHLPWRDSNPDLLLLRRIG
jgi:hypothetical protein